MKDEQVIKWMGSGVWKNGVKVRGFKMISRFFAYATENMELIH